MHNWNINFNFNLQNSKRFRKVLTHFIQGNFIQYPIPVICFSFGKQFISFSFDYFIYSKFFLISFLQFFLIKNSNNLFTIKITNNISPWNSDCNWTRTQNHLVLKRPNDWAMFWVLICTVHLTVCSCHVTYTFQSLSCHVRVFAFLVMSHRGLRTK